MSLAHDLGRRVLGILAAERSPTTVHVAALDRDVGAQLLPSVYPYPHGGRPIAPFGTRVTLRGLGKPRSAAQLAPPTGNPTQRALAHVTYAGIAGAQRSATADASGRRVPAKITRTRPWLFSGGRAPSSSAPASPAASGGPCEGCE